MTDAPAVDLATKPFDELIGELQRVVQALEAGNLPLEESIRLYRHGLELTISQLGRGLIEEPVEGGSAPAELAPEPGEGL